MSSEQRRKDIERAAKEYGALEFGSSSTAASNMPSSEVATRSKTAQKNYIKNAMTKDGQALNLKNEQVLVDDINAATAPEMSRLRRVPLQEDPSFLQQLINFLRSR